MSPILVRPVREQLEHDRVIRLLQAKYRRKSEVAINPGNQQAMPVGAGLSAWFPDLVLYVSEKNRKVIGVVEVETAESVNHLEAMSQWGAFSRLRIPFHLYIPVQMVDVGRRLCQDLQLTPPEIYSYQAIGDQIRFTLVQKGAYGEPKGGKPAVSVPAPKPAAPDPAAPNPAVPKPVAAVKPAAVKPVAVKPVAAKPVPAKAVPPKAVPPKAAAAKAGAKPAAKAAVSRSRPPAKRGAASAPKRKAPAAKAKPAAKTARKASASARASKRR